jgi:hypothetical protein
MRFNKSQLLLSLLNHYTSLEDFAVDFGAGEGFAVIEGRTNYLA